MNERPVPKDKKVKTPEENKKKLRELEKEAEQRAIATFYAGRNPND